MTFRFFGRTPMAPITSAAIRQEQRIKEDRRALLIAARQTLAHEELRGDLRAAAKRADLDQRISVLDREIQTLSDALPTALDFEHVERRHEQERLLSALRHALAEREQERDALLAELIDTLLPTIEEMNALRLVSRECSEIQHILCKHTGESFTHIDALAVLRSAVHDRHEEFERRWIRTKPDQRPDLAARPWQQTAAALRTLHEQDRHAS